MDPNAPYGGMQPGWVPPPGSTGAPAWPGWTPPQKQKKFGWGGLIGAFLLGGFLSAIVVFGGLVVLALAFGTPDSVAGTHPSLAEGAAAVKVGDCIEGRPGVAVVHDRSEVVDCDEAHGSEVAAVIETPGFNHRPGEDELATFTDEACSLAFEGYVGSDPTESQFDYAAIVPSDAAWADGDRTIFCMVDTTSLGPGEGTARNSRR